MTPNKTILIAILLLVCTLIGYSSEIYSVSISPDGKWLALGSGDKTVKVWEVATEKPTRTLQPDLLPIMNN